MGVDSKPEKTWNCHGCGETGHYVRECNDRKSVAGTGKVVLNETIGFMTMEDPVLFEARTRGWYLLSRCTVHVCNSRDMFVEYRPLSGHEVIMEDNNSRVDVVGIGTVMLRLTTGKVLTLSNVFHMPTIRKCCLSISKLCDIGLNISLGRGKATILRDEEIVGKGYTDGGLYRLSIIEECAGGIETHKEITGLVTDRLEEDSNTWARGWYLNSKTNLHMCNSRDMFVDYHPVHDEQVNMGENDSVKVAGIGTVMVRFTTGKVLTLSNVCYAPTIDKCLVSVSKLDDTGFNMVFGGGEVVIKKSDEILGKGYKQGGLYRLSIIEGQDTKSEVKVVLKEKISLIPDNEDPVLSNLRRRGWYLASRCTVHVCNSRDMFTDYQPWSGHEVILDNNEHVEVAGAGTVKLRFTTGKVVTLTNVFHMPTIRNCLISLRKFPENGFSMCSGEGGEILIKKDNKIFGKGYKEDGLLRLSIVDERQGGD